MLRKLTAGMFAVALIFLVLGCSGDKTSAKKEDSKKGDDAKKADDSKKGEEAGEGGEGEALTKETVKWMNDLSETLDGVKDKASAEKVKTKLEELADKGKELKERSKKLANLPKEQQEALKKKYEADILKATGKMQAAMLKLQGNPDAKKVLDPILQKLQ